MLSLPTRKASEEQLLQVLSKSPKAPFRCSSGRRNTWSLEVSPNPARSHPGLLKAVEDLDRVGEEDEVGREAATPYLDTVLPLHLRRWLQLPRMWQLETDTAIDFSTVTEPLIKGHFTPHIAWVLLGNPLWVQ